MARRRSTDEGSNMDSLLDALTNVVGILLLVLILTSINMNEAVRKILSELIPVTPEQFESNKVLRDRKLTELDQLKNNVETFDSPQAIEQKLAELDLELEEMSSDTSVADLQAQLAALQARIEEEEAKKETNEDNINTSSDELNRLLAILQDLDQQEGPPPTVVTLPAGREAREGSEPRFVMCIGGRAFYVGNFYAHTTAIRQEVEKNFTKLVYTGDKLGSYTYGFRGDKWDRERNRYDELRPRAEGLVFRRFRYDGDKIIRHFKDNQSKLGTADVVYNLEKNGDRLRLYVSPRPGGGVALDSMFAPGSPLIDGYKEALRDSRGKQNYLYFVVAPDSFDVYLEARRVADEKQIPNGWKPWNPGENPRLIAQVNQATFREFLQYETSDIIPMQALTAHANKILPVLRKNMDDTQTMVSKVTDPAVQKAAAQWANGFKGTYFDVERHIPQATPLFKGFETVVTDPQLPDVPLVRIFSPVSAGSMPVTAPKPLPPKEKEPEKKVVRDILD